MKTSDAIPEERRLDFLEQVFWNVHDIIAVNMKLREALNKRQKSYAVVERIGDIFLDVVPQFAPFVSYGSHQLYGKYEFEKEKSSNPAFQKFVDVRISIAFFFCDGRDVTEMTCRKRSVDPNRANWNSMATSPSPPPA